MVGRSGRIVVELDPELKRRLHARLRSEGRDLKGWMLERVREYLGPSPQGEPPPPDLGEVEMRVLQAVSCDARPKHVDDLLRETGYGIGELHTALLQLELEGRVVQQFGFYRPVMPS